MPSENKTPNLGLNQWQGNEYIKRQDFVEDNQKIDTAFGNLEDLTTEEKSDLVGAINEIENTVKTHLADYAGLKGFIIDQGSNDNGSYIKWSNGLQICWGSNTFPSEGWTGSGDKRYLTGQSLNFPVTFDSNPSFFGTTQDASIAARSAKLANFVARVNVGTSNVTDIAFNGWGTTSNDFILHWLAIGWWK